MIMLSAKIVYQRSGICYVLVDNLVSYKRYLTYQVKALEPKGSRGR